MPNNEVVVLDIAGGTAHIYAADASHERTLKGLGFSHAGDRHIRPIVDESDRKSLVRRLVEIGALFSAGKDWSPAEIVNYYREKNLVMGQYRVIAWRSPDSFYISSR